MVQQASGAERRHQQHSSHPLFRDQHYGRTGISPLSFSAATSNDESTIQFVGKEEMEEILEDFEQGDSGYCVLDVRNEDEVESTGKLSKSVITCPLLKIKELHAFELHPEDFEEEFGFVKPHFDDTLVFTCAAGKRAQMAAELAAIDGYPNIVVYTGGANEWFGPPSVEVP